MGAIITEYKQFDGYLNATDILFINMQQAWFQKLSALRICAIGHAQLPI